MLRVFLILQSLVFFAAPCLAELQPGEVALVAARGNRESEALAKYYARMRGVPEENICLVDVPRSEVCPAEIWRWGVRPEIHKWLKENDPQQKIRCLVALWGVPLKINRAANDPEAIRYKQFLEAERGARLQLLGQILKSFSRIAPGVGEDEASGPPADSPGTADTLGVAGRPPGSEPTASNESASATEPEASPAPQPTSEFVRLQSELEAALQQAQARVKRLREGDQQSRSQSQLQQLATAAGGMNVVLPALNQQLEAAAGANPSLQSEADTLRGRLLGLMETKSLLDQMPVGIEHDAIILAALERVGGLIATVNWLDQQLDVVKKGESGSSFDSELALVMWPDGYQLLRWQPNYLRPSFANSQLPQFYRTLMVSRIDAPTLRLAKGLIDTAIEVEEKGLQGKVYLDARGLAKLEGEPPQQGSYADFDRSLLATAKGIEEQTDLEVVLENTPRLFQAGECPDAALYCGWYSLANYVDAFEWNPGAVAYHLASSEASTLRDPASQVWCKKLLEDGVCATIGPVYEPYLIAFPRPNEFFALLLQGDLTLVECYARTQPFTSWMMTLIGDPLYRPYKTRMTEPKPVRTP